MDSLIDMLEWSGINIDEGTSSAVNINLSHIVNTDLYHMFVYSCSYHGLVHFVFLVYFFIVCFEFNCQYSIQCK